MDCIFLSSQILRRVRALGHSKEIIARACAIYKNTNNIILDCCAGNAIDAFILTALGARVISCEKDKIIYNNIIKQVELGLKDPRISPILSSMHFINIDACDYINNNSDKKFDIIYMDPMFPDNIKKTAASKLNITKLKQIAPYDDSSTRELFQVALNYIKLHNSRLVVKRPLKSPPIIADLKPSFEYRGKTCRFDCYY